MLSAGDGGQTGGRNADFLPPLLKAVLSQ